MADTNVLSPPKATEGSRSRPRRKQARREYTAAANGLSVCVGHGFSLSISVDSRTDPNTKKSVPANIVVQDGNRRLYCASRWSTLCVVEELLNVRLGRNSYRKQKAFADAAATIREAWRGQPYKHFPVDAVEPAPAITSHKEHGASGDIRRPRWCPGPLWKKLVKRDRESCVACGIFLMVEIQPTAHHLLPRSEGGKTELGNLVLLCRPCHDRLEAAQEASLMATQRPPRRAQLEGVFRRIGVIVPPRIRRIEPALQRLHAERILRETEPSHIPVLLLLARREGRWSHVDWDHIEQALANA